MNRQFQTQSPLLRLSFVAAALVATLGLGGFIDTLATGYAQQAEQVHAAKVQLARR